MSKAASPVSPSGIPQVEGANNAFEPRNTDPKTVLVGLLQSAQNAIIPALAIAFSTAGMGLLIALPVAAAIVAIGTLFSYIAWKRLTYTIGAADIRVESGVLSRSARSVPYERIQDVSLEQKLLPRLLGLVAVKFETGAGGGEDLSLSYLTEERGEEMRQLVRERKDGQASGALVEDCAASPIGKIDEEAVALFTMPPKRLLTFGLFSFSLAVFAVLAGLLQYVDSFLDFDFWELEVWQGLIEDYGFDLSALDRTVQIVGIISSIGVLVAIGLLTGVVRVFLREWGFLLERTARGFRRRRGLLTKTDVVMPIHRVQGVKIGTRFIRYRFGWHSLSFVSLAQDSGASSHVVAPFAKIDEISPIAEVAGFTLPGESSDWRRASEKFLFDSAVRDALFFLIPAVVAGIASSIYSPEWTSFVVGALFVLAGISAALNVLAWRYQRHALDTTQIVSARGVLAPRSQIATRLKLHSVEIAQGPIARWRGYATLHLGQAGGVFAIPGVSLERAQEVRRKVMETIAATDFSQLDTA
ncbi:PH domain-containing protein [uncultured Erythrobacter sp.]|uniref:PH domain-containing protein n=1 Tax=uncultured Erythrobacter sp. TaxID=263913 RepID=UPI002619D912|nr:PH domain-containing protein [uncultured Erythrobacter sp.]